jgi:PhnB protein
MLKINPYLNFNGNTEEAFEFYKSVFGGEFTILQRFKDIPDSDKLPKEVHEKIMHVSLPIGENITLMGTDSLEAMGQFLVIGNNVSISINTDTKDEADKIFKKLSEDGNITIDIADSFWGAYFGMFEDKFGIQWMINYDYN